jgi:hypothetical protein
LHHPRFLSHFSNVHLGRGGSRLLAFACECAASPEEYIAKTAAGAQEKQKTDDQTNDPFAVRGAEGVICQECDRTGILYAYLLPLAVSTPWSPPGLLPPLVLEEGTLRDMPVIKVFELDLRD